jgi:hypothetical protein
LDSRNPNPGVPPFKLLWLPMVAAVLIYGVVAFLIADGDPKPLGPLATVLPVAALFTGGTAYFIRSRIDPSENPMMGSLVVWCLDEGVAVIGLVAAILSNTAQSYVAYGAVALCLLLLHRPR